MRQLANYTIEEEPIARGGMGQIYRGYDSNGNLVAIKEILPEFASDFTILERLEKEVDFLMRVNDPSIVKCYSAFHYGQSFYIVLDYIEGLNIEQYVAANGPIEEQKTVDMLLKTLTALQSVHEAHIVHRDIKPSNIMVRPNGDICLLDFGVAKDMDNQGGTAYGTVIGTSGYMSPEQADGYSINYRSDIYSLGCVVFFMLTGHHAYSTLASEFETKEAIRNNPFPRISDYRKGVSVALQKSLDKATSRNMMQRYSTCYEWISDLKSGTHISHSNLPDTPRIIITIGREKCDIIINDDEHKISRHHADVELKIFTGGSYCIFSDCSSNGTIVNGKPLRKSSVDIPIDIQSQQPVIYLAGVRQGYLDWGRVMAELRKREAAMRNATVTTEVTSELNNDAPVDFEEMPDSDIAGDKPGVLRIFWATTWRLFAALLCFAIAVGLTIWVFNVLDGSSGRTRIKGSILIAPIYLVYSGIKLLISFLKNLGHK